jgi:hypothetical protein
LKAAKLAKPAPLETDTGKQQDDNIDDLGRRPDGSRHELPDEEAGGKKASSPGKA